MQDEEAARTATDLYLWRIALMSWQLMRILHPWDSLRDLYVQFRRKRFRMVVSGTLDINKARKNFLIVVEETCAAVPTNVSTTMWGGLVNLGHSLCYCKRRLGIHGPADHWAPACRRQSVQ